MLVAEMVENMLVTKEDVAGGIHCMHPNFLQHQLNASKANLGLDTIDLMYLQNSYETHAHFLDDTQAFYDKLAKAFDFYETKCDSGDIQNYGLATYLCFRSPPDEDKIHLNL